MQIGDPFYGKLLMEACLKAMRKNLVVAGQDMGAAGIISSSFEMISKGNIGMKMYLDKVPLRDASMTAEEILLSESQERALLVVLPNNYPKLKEIFEKEGLLAEVIGELNQTREVEIFWKEKKLLKIDPALLTKKAPRYKRPYHNWTFPHITKNQEDTKCVSSTYSEGVIKVLLSLLKDIRGCDWSFIYQQYDQRVGARTVKDASFPLGFCVCLTLTGL